MEAIDDAVQAKVPHNRLLKIQSVYDVLKSAERKAVDFLLEAPERVGGMTIVEFAHEAGCSEATVVRVAKRLGYAGYPDLRRDFARVTEEVPDYNYESIADGDAPFTVLNKVVQSTIGALQDSVEIIDATEYGRAVDAIATADKMLFCGLGDAGVVATEAHYRFTRFGVASYAAVDPDLQLMYARQLKRGKRVRRSSPLPTIPWHPWQRWRTLSFSQRYSPGISITRSCRSASPSCASLRPCPSVSSCARAPLHLTSSRSPIRPWM